MQLIYTSFYAGILAIFMIFLAAKVAMARRKYKVGLGDSGEHKLLKRVRVHGNAVEYIPIGLILLAISEVNKANLYFINVCGIIFVLGRFMHAFGLGNSSGISFGRFYGSLLSWSVILILAFYNIGYGIGFLAAS